MEEVNLFDNAILLSLTLHVLGNSAKGDIGEVETGADKSLLKLSKQLLDCPEYKELIDIKNEIANAVKRKAFGGDTKKYVGADGNTYQVGQGLQALIKRGCYLIPTQMVTTIDALLEEKVPLFSKAVTKLCGAYEEAKEQSRQRLGPQFNESDYKSLNEIRRTCSIDYKYLSIGVPNSLKAIKESLFEKEKKKMQAAWSEAQDEIRLVLRVTFKELLDHAVDRLKCGEDGKKKKFHDTMIAKMQEFLTDFAGKNLTNDDELTQMVSTMKGVLAGKTADKLRKDDDMRARLVARMEEVKQELDKKIENAPIRAILLD